MKALTAILITLALLVGASVSGAQIAARNISKTAEQFEIERRIVFYNGITEGLILVIQGRCSIEPNADKLAVTCRTGEKAFKKHYLGLSDNVTYFVEQLENVDVGTYHYRVIFKPQSVLPNIDFEGSVSG